MAILNTELQSKIDQLIDLGMKNGKQIEILITNICSKLGIFIQIPKINGMKRTLWQRKFLMLS